MRSHELGRALLCLGVRGLALAALAGSRLRALQLPGCHAASGSVRAAFSCLAAAKRARANFRVEARAQWLPRKDLNLDKQDQNLLCYRYTTGHWSRTAKNSANRAVAQPAAGYPAWI
jgi:hypothetical protein